ncbi:hypothetical protein AB9K35_17975 [Leisingera sp. XS_AS12]|uniref:hypothetical protein n=1 Tax=Leisingera sp. XS_AS12 TaxID=3241294 RepID=UPI0035110CA9
MPIIASQHRWKDKDHVAHLRKDWPDDCKVQWGGSGIVLGEKKGPRQTAFFEAFPKSGGFIRGEGATIEEAENNAFRRFREESACQHQWGRRGYTNGGCRCARCGAFKTVMKPIVKLGGYRDPIKSMEIEIAISRHGLAPSSRSDRDGSNTSRKIWLRLRRAGIDLPPIPDKPEPENHDDPFAPSTFAAACREAIFSYFDAHGGLDLLEGRGDLQTMQGLFDGMSLAWIKWDYRVWLESKAEGAPAPDM